jgi:hypothetical protein
MNSPVAIGGVGGSGTRVVAQILMTLGYDLGSDLNSANDNLWFNLLLYRPRWFASGRRDVRTALDLQRKHALGQRDLTPRELAFLALAVADITRDAVIDTRPLHWCSRRIREFFRSRPASDRWGWKEPISHLIVGDLLEHFPDARYIHVVRHGLDMAFSGNQNQTRLFAPLFGVTGQTAPAALSYWVRANRRAIDQMSSHPDRTLLVNFDRLCLEPAQEIDRILTFLRVSADISLLAQLPKPPASIGRYRTKSLDGFNPSDLDAVAEITEGYSPPKAA